MGERSPSQVILTAVMVSDPKSGEGGYLQKWDFNTGLSLGITQKELSFSGAGGVALFPPRLDLSTPALVTLNSKNSSLNYYLIGKERPLHRFFGLDRLCALEVSPTGELLAGGNDEGKLFLWDIPSGELLVKIEDAHLQKINTLKFNSDGSLLASASRDGSVKVWSLPAIILGGKSCSPLFTFSEHTDSVTDLYVGFGLGQNCRLITACSDKKVRLYDLVDGGQLAEFELPSPVTKVLMTLEETLIIGGCKNGTIYLVDIASEPGELSEQSSLKYSTRYEKFSLSSHRQSISALSLSFDQVNLTSSDEAGHIIIWNLPARQIVRRIIAEGPIHWMAIVSKASYDVILDQKSTFSFVIGQPKRTISQLQSSFSTIRRRPLGSKLQQPSTIVESHQVDTIDELKVTYARLLEHVFSRFEKK